MEPNETIMSFKFDDILPDDESHISKATSDIIRLQILFSEMESYLGVYKSKFPEITIVQDGKQFVITYTGKDNIAFSDFITEFCLHFYDELLSLPPGYQLRLPDVKQGKYPYTFKLDITSTATDEIEQQVSKYIKLLDLICEWRVESDIPTGDTMDSVMVNVNINDSFLANPTLKKFINESHNDHEWGFYLYANIVEHLEHPHFTIYYSDGFEIITSWFPGWLLRKHISLSLMAREGEGEGISATKVRHLVLMDSTSELSKIVPSPVMDKFELIKSYLSVKFPN